MKTLWKIIFGLLVIGFIYLISCVLYGNHWSEEEIELQFIEELSGKSDVFNDLTTTYLTNDANYKYVSVNCDYADNCPDHIKLNHSYHIRIEGAGFRTWKDFFTFGEQEWKVDEFLENE